jgi:hypothetical protein
MFLGLEKEVDLVVSNNEGEDVFSIAKKIHEAVQEEIFAYTE